MRGAGATGEPGAPAAGWSKVRGLLSVPVACLVLLLAGCGYRHYAGPLQPAPEAGAATEFSVADDGTVTYTQGRLEISVRPLTDEELNRQFASHSSGGIRITNPYTFGDWVDPETGTRPPRFTVFLLRVKNYMFPKMQLDPADVRLAAANGREYRALDVEELGWYYQKYLTSYSGNHYLQYKERLGLLRRTMYASEPVFSGQEQEGFLVFPVLHHDVRRVALQLRQVSLRFDVWDEPIEQVDVAYLFQRETGRIYPDGRRAAER